MLLTPAFFIDEDYKALTILSSKFFVSFFASSDPLLNNYPFFLGLLYL